MRKLFIWLILGIFMISMVSAFEFDNIKQYDAQKKEVTIINAFGLGGDIAKIKLNTPQNYIVPIGYQKVAQFTITGYDNYEDYLTGLEFFNINNKMSKINRNYDYKYLTYNTVPNYILQCNESQNKNGTIEETCEGVQDGTKQVEVWNDLSSQSLKENDVITIGIFTNVEKGDFVEWIPTMFGIEISEWASWTATLSAGLFAYWNMDEGAGDYGVIIDNPYQTSNLTNVNATNVTGKIVYGYKLDNTTHDFLNYTGGFATLNNATNYTINFWVNTSDKTTQATILENNVVGQQRLAIQFRNGEIRARVYDKPDTTVGGTYAPNINVWAMVTLVHYANNTMVLLVNNATVSGGSETVSTQGGGNFALGIANVYDTTYIFPCNCTIDEIGMWNRSLNQSEIDDLYNNGDGITYPVEAPAVDVNLSLPVDVYNSTSQTVIFSANVSSTLNAIANVSLIINATYNQTNTSGINDTVYNFTAVLPYGFWNWTYEACDTSDTCTNETPRTMTINRTIENNVTYNTSVSEATNQNYILNIDVSPILSISTAYLDYDGNTTLSSLSRSGINYIITANRNAPVVNTNTNKTFFWTLTLNDSTQINTTSYNQTVLNIGIDNCSINNDTLINYTLVDEDDQDQLTNGTIEISADLFSSDGLLLISSFNETINGTNAGICITDNATDNSTYSLFSIARYTSSAYSTEYHHIQNQTFDNATSTQNITLYDLLTSSATNFKITYRDRNFLPVANAIIQVNRQYVGESVFKTVEAPLTSAKGETVAHLIKDDMIYNFIVIQNGTVLDSFNNLVAFCEDVVSENCFITLNSLAGSGDIFSYDEEIGLAYSIDYNSTTRLLRVVFATTSGSAHNVSMNVTKADQLGNTTACFDYLVSSSGTLSCTVPASIGNHTVYITLAVDGEDRISQYFFLERPINLGYGGYFLMLIMILTLALMFTESKTMTVFAVILGFIASVLFSFISGGIMSGGAIMWLVIAGTILIYKLNSDRIT